MKAPIVALLLVGCQNKNSCAELQQYAPAGVTLARGEAQCAEMLAFADTVPSNYGMDFRTWLATVVPQRTYMVQETIFALVGQRSWTPQSFDPVPNEVPCGHGVPLTDDLWASSPLSQILGMRPKQLYVSLAVEIPASPGDMAAIRVYQDFDCDHVVGVMELVGEFKVGLPILGGGWQLQSTVVSPINE